MFLINLNHFLLKWRKTVTSIFGKFFKLQNTAWLILMYWLFFILDVLLGDGILFVLFWIGRICLALFKSSSTYWSFWQILQTGKKFIHVLPDAWLGYGLKNILVIFRFFCFYFLQWEISCMIFSFSLNSSNLAVVNAGSFLSSKVTF